MFRTCQITNICDCYAYVFDDLVFIKLLSLQILALVCDILGSQLFLSLRTGCKGNWCSPSCEK